MLFVAVRPPYPLDTGAKIRSWHILSGLCSKYSVDVLVYRDEKHDVAWSRAAKELGVNRLIQLDNSILNKNVSTVSIIWSLLRGLPATVGKYQSQDILRSFQDRLQDGYELVHIEHVHLSWLFRYVKNNTILCSLDAHNVETLIAQRMRDMERSIPRRIALGLHAYNMARFERSAFARADIVLSVSREDVKMIAEMGGKKDASVLVENGVDIAYFSPDVTAVSSDRNGISTVKEGEENSLVFVGSMDWQPNIDGVRWFVAEILPLIKRKIPDSRLTIVGRDPHPSICALANHEEGVIVTGTVADVRSYVRSAMVEVVPLRYGGGTRLKVLEAFAMGTPVVSTTLGCEGISYDAGRHLLLADNPEEFAKKCCTLLEDHNRRTGLAREARKLVLARYSWGAIIGKMLQALDAAFEKKGAL